MRARIEKVDVLVCTKPLPQLLWNPRFVTTKSAIFVLCGPYGHTKKLYYIYISGFWGTNGTKDILQCLIILLYFTTLTLTPTLTPTGAQSELTTLTLGAQTMPYLEKYVYISEIFR